MRKRMTRILFSLTVIVDGQWVKYFVILWMVLSFGYDIRVTIYFSLLWEIVVKKPSTLSLYLQSLNEPIGEFENGFLNVFDSSCSFRFPLLHLSSKPALPFLLDCCCGLVTVPCCHSSASHWVTPSPLEPPESQSHPRTPQSSAWPIVCEWAPPAPHLLQPPLLCCSWYATSLFCHRALACSFV